MQTEDNTQGSTPALDDTPSLSPTLPTKAHQNEDQAL
jgi:hypothetical protein